MAKSPDAFRTISEVAEWLGVQAHVLRFWESKFSQVKPVKRAGGRRYYRPSDMQLLDGIRKLLHDDGLTIKGVQKILREQGVSHVSGLSKPLELGAEDAESGDLIEGTAEEIVDEIVKEVVQEEITAVRFQRSERPLPDTAAETAPDAIQAPPQAADSEAADPASTDDTPELPSFLHRSAQGLSQPAQPEEPPRASLVVDAPDPPALDEIRHTPGPLASLARIKVLSPGDAAAIAPVAAALRDLAAGAGDTPPV